MGILVTGGAGYIGSHMVYKLVDETEEKVVVLDDLSTGFRQLVPAEVPLVVGNTGDRPLTSRLIAEHEVDTVIHFAASVVVPESVRDPLRYYQNNTMNTCNLLEVAIAKGVKHFIFSSTAAVYGSPAKIPVREDDLASPISPYGTSKLITEHILKDVGRAHGLRHVILRYFNVAGADPHGRTGQSTANATHLIKLACEAALGKRTKVEVFGTDYQTVDGTGVRDYIHVADLVSAHLAALYYLRNGGESAIFNCGYGHGASVLEVIKSVKRVSGAEIPVDVCSRREGDPAALIADVARIRAALDWKPKYDDLDTIIRHALSWERRIGRLRN